MQAFLGLEGLRKSITDRFDFNPVMSDQALLQFDDPESCARAELLLKSHKLFGAPAFWCQRKEDSLMIQSQWTKPLPEDAELEQEGTGKRVPFFEVFYSMDVVKSGFHHPDGMFWVCHPERQHVVHPDKMSIRSIAPLVLSHFGLSASAASMGDKTVAGRA